MGTGIALAWNVAGPVEAKELDQFTFRRFQVERLRDATAILDGEMERVMEKLERELNRRRGKGEAGRMAALRSVFQHPVAPELVAPFELWIVQKSPVPQFKLTDRGIFRLADYDDMSLTFYVGLAEVLRVADTLVGVDKFSHFFGQGWRYYELDREFRTSGEKSEAGVLERIRKVGHSMEQSYLGVDTTGVYSYADLAANMQGYRFFRNLFEEHRGSPPFFEETADGYRRMRRFSWKDYVTDDWDEVLNPSVVLSERFFGKIKEAFRRPRTHGSRDEVASICSEYRKAPEVFMRWKGNLGNRREYVWSGASELPTVFPVDVRTICGEAK